MESNESTADTIGCGWLVWQYSTHNFHIRLSFGACVVATNKNTCPQINIIVNIVLTLQFRDRERDREKNRSITRRSKSVRCAHVSNYQMKFIKFTLAVELKLLSLVCAHLSYRMKLRAALRIGENSKMLFSNWFCCFIFWTNPCEKRWRWWLVSNAMNLMTE